MSKAVNFKDVDAGKYSFEKKIFLVLSGVGLLVALMFILHLSTLMSNQDVMRSSILYAWYVYIANMLSYGFAGVTSGLIIFILLAPYVNWRKDR